MYSTHKNTMLLSRLFEEGLHQGIIAIIDELFSHDFVDHSTPQQPIGRQGVKDYFAAVRRGFPDMHVTIDDVITEGNKVVVRSTWRGTHLGLYGTAIPTGNPVTRTLIQIFSFQDGKLQEEWNEGKDLLT